MHRVPPTHTGRCRFDLTPQSESVSVFCLITALLLSQHAQFPLKNEMKTKIFVWNCLLPSVTVSGIHRDKYSTYNLLYLNASFDINLASLLTPCTYMYSSKDFFPDFTMTCFWRVVKLGSRHCTSQHHGMIYNLMKRHDQQVHSKFTQGTIQIKISICPIYREGRCRELVLS